jgi:hypothetical protein
MRLAGDRLCGSPRTGRPMRLAKDPPAHAARRDPSCLAPARSTIYLVAVSTSSFSPEEVRAAAEVHGELGSDYQAAVVDSFLDKVGREIDARVDARVAEQQTRRPPRERSAFAVVIASMIFGIPLSAIAVGDGPHPAGLAGLVVIWVAIAVINIAYATHVKRPYRR